MAEPVAISRKEFFRTLLRPSAHLARSRGEARPVPADGEDEPPPEALQSDFPPALLAEEAARLGLDPHTTDRDTLLRAVYGRMREQRGGSSH